ncbi:hypothetical protein KCH_11510 [Kitasatospora cheerisanensis KCTC 2395]|uniref:Uncharacterized protein n=1 Tax=Kitasatospora cheerisanensis KCTC 2395 TaxID=1348663 RepID=A0A066Z9T0_9ACTN|nr:hypothetical protein KCH_11510 [Kitasatospora cheerisanensis KCTC 2395]
MSGRGPVLRGGVGLRELTGLVEVRPTPVRLRGVRPGGTAARRG